jgi:hypothetical protein
MTLGRVKILFPLIQLNIHQNEKSVNFMLYAIQNYW